MGASRLAIIIPAHNEAKTIAPVLDAAREFGHLIVVDDGSSDGTDKISRAHGADVVVHAQNGGYDRALSSGFARAAESDCELAITIDADGQLPPALIPRFVDALDAGADLVVGIRDHVPRVSEKLFQAMARRLYGLTDPLCGMKAYRMRYYAELGHFDSYRSIGTELMLYVMRKGGRLAEIPVPTRPRAGKARIGGRLRANWVIGRAAGLALIHHVTR